MKSPVRFMARGLAEEIWDGKALAFSLSRYKPYNGRREANASRVTIFPIQFSNGRHAFASPRRDTPELLPERCPSTKRTQGDLQEKAQGMPGARCTHSLVCKGRKHTSIRHRYTGCDPAFPAQWFYGL